MKRLTRDARLAMERLAERLDIDVSKVAGGYRLTNGRGSHLERPLSAKRSLAKLVRWAQFKTANGGGGMTREEVRDVIRLTRVTPHGTVAHEEEAIREVLTR